MRGFRQLVYRSSPSSLVDSRTNLTHALLHLMSRMLERPAVLVSASAVGYYGVPASDAPQAGRFQSDLCAAIGHEALGVRVVRLRIGIVLGAGGGADPALSTAARLGQHAVPDAASAAGYRFRRPSLRGALGSLAACSCNKWLNGSRSTGLTW